MIICNKNTSDTSFNEVYIFNQKVYEQQLSDTFKRRIMPIDGVAYELLVRLLPDDVKLKSVFKDNNAGGYFDTTLTFNIYEHTNQVKMKLDDVKQQKLIVLLRNNHYTLLGDRMQPFVLSFTEVYPAKQKDDSFFQVKIKGQTITPLIDGDIFFIN